jgi:hypothetical protein
MARVRLGRRKGPKRPADAAGAAASAPERAQLSDVTADGSAADVFTLWVDAGLWACCGDVFSVGSTVHMDLHEDPAPDWLAERLPPGVLERVTHVEDHHSIEPNAVDTEGVVLSISAAFCRYAPSDERPHPGPGQFYAPVAGTAVLQQWRTSQGPRETDLAVRGALEHVGYVVELSVRRPKSWGTPSKRNTR